MKSYMITNTILGIFNQFIDRQTNGENFKPNEGVYFITKIDGHNFGFEKDGNTQHPEWHKITIKYWHVIILSRRMVFTCLSDDNNMPSPDKWTNTSNHSSCFRQDGLNEITYICFDIWDEIYKNTPKQHRPSTKSESIDLTLSHGFLFGPVFKCVEVDYKPISYEDSYHKKLLRIDLIEKTITVKA